jgi:hypothetical protein
MKLLATLTLLAASSVISAVLSSESSNLRPIVGILAIPSTESRNSFMHASYVEWLQQGGARVVPIPHDTPFDELDKISHTHRR